MKLRSSLRNIVTGPSLTFKKFPVTLLLSTLLTFILTIISETKPHEDTLNKIAMIIALGIPLSLCIKLFFHRKENSFKRLFIYYVSGAALLVLYYIFYLTNFNMVSITRYTGVSLTLYLAFLFTPYFFDKEGFELYVIRVFTSFFITLIYSLVLYLGLSAILFTIDKLLGVNIASKVYYYTWLFVACIFGPSYFLADIPLSFSPISRDSYPKLIRILLLYIVMPLLTAYTVILYLYFGKILITRQWPVGIVSHLVLWYSVITAAVIFLTTPIREESSWTNRFQMLLPKIILPIMVMMFVSMGIRIGAYGVTERRYFVVVLGLWVLGVMLYFSLSRVRRNIILPVSLSIIALISVFGPVSSYSISKMSQNNRLKAILIRNNMLSDGVIKPSAASVSKEDRAQISGILDYFNTNHSLPDVRYIPKGFKISDMERVFGFSHENAEPYIQNNYFYFTREQIDAPLNVQGYDYLIDMRNLYNKNNSKNTILNASYDQDTSLVKISYQGREIYSKNLNSFAEGLVNKYGIMNKDGAISPEDMIFEEENENIRVKFIFTNISGQKDSLTDKAIIKSADFSILVKVK